MACGNECNGDVLAVLPEVQTGEEIPDPPELLQEPRPKPQATNMDGEVDSLEGIDMTMHDSLHGDVLAELSEVRTGEELAVPPESQQEQRSKPQARNMDGVVDSIEGMDMTMRDSLHGHAVAEAEAEAELVNLIEEFHRLDPPAFMGASNPAEAEEWFCEIDKKLGLMRAKDEQRIALATSMLKGEAIHWWDMNKHTMDIDGMTWRDFQETFLERYFPFSDRNLKKYELLRLAQKEVWAQIQRKSKEKMTTRSSNYARQKKELHHPYTQPGPVDTTVAEKNCYKCGQNGHISRFCQLSQQEQQKVQLVDGEHLGARDKKRKEDKTSESSNPNLGRQDQQQHHHPHNQPALVVEGQGVLQSSLGKWKCNECGHLGHLRRDCPLWLKQLHQHPYNLPALVVKGQEAQQTSFGNGKCFKCGQLGHMVKDCPSKQQQQQQRQRQLQLLRAQQHQQQQQHPCSQPALVAEGHEAQHTSVDKRICSKCGQLGHLRKCCPLPLQQQQQHPYSQPALVVETQEVQKTSVDKGNCNKCGKIGHVGRGCTSLRQHRKKQQPEVAVVEVNLEDFWAIEKKRKEGKTKSNNKRQKQTHPLNQPAPAVEDQVQRKCFRCGQTGHYKKDCPVGAEQQQVTIQVTNQQSAQEQVTQIQQGPVQQPAQAQVILAQQGLNQQLSRAKAKKPDKFGNKRPFSQLGAPLSAFLPELLEKGLVILRDPKPIPTQMSKGFDHGARCGYHQSLGHTTDQCLPLRHAIQDLLEEDKLKIPGVQLPAELNVNNNS